MTERLKGYEGGEDRIGSEGWETKDNIRYVSDKTIKAGSIQHECVNLYPWIDTRQHT